MTDKNTKELGIELISTDNLEEYIGDNARNFRHYTLKEYFDLLFAEKNLKLSQVVKDSHLGNYAYHILSGEKNTSRENILSLAVAMKLSPDETNYLLYYANHGQIYPRNKWDSVISFALNKHKNIVEINDFLEKWNLSPLGMRVKQLLTREFR